MSLKKKNNKNKIPVTVLSGFLGAGKTTILNNMLNNLENQKITIIVNDMSKINIDAQLVKRTEEKMIELSNGCICCTLREDLLNQLVEIGKTKSCDYIVIESTGIAEPLHIAETFAYAEQTPLDPNDLTNKSTLSGLIKLDTMVTVVDLQTFLCHYNSSDVPDSSLCSTNNNNSTTSTTTTSVPTISPDERTLSNLLIDQIQFANIIILNKCDLVSKQQCSDIKGIVTDLNPHAKIILSSYGRNIPIKKLINTNLFSYESAEQHTEWFATEWGITSPVPETIEYGITSITFQTHSRPFHPLRLYNFYQKYKLLLNSFIESNEHKIKDTNTDDTNNDNNTNTSTTTSTTITNENNKSKSQQQQQQLQLQQFKLLRSKGFIWLPWNYKKYYLLHHTGGSLAIQEKDTWWIAKDPSNWPNNPEFEKEIGYLLHGEKSVKYGDRGNTLILIGQHATKQKWNEITEELNSCLFNDDEMREMDNKEENKEWIDQWNNPFSEIPNLNSDSNNYYHDDHNDDHEEDENEDSDENDENDDEDDESDDEDEDEKEGSERNEDNNNNNDHDDNNNNNNNEKKKRLHSNIESNESQEQKKRNIKPKK